MTVSTTSASSGPFIGNGATTTFPFSFLSMSVGEVRVLVDGEEVAGFTVTLAGPPPSAGSVIFSTAPAIGRKVTIESAPDFRQEISFANAGAFLPETHDDANDRAAIRDLALKDKTDRALVVPSGEGGATLPTVAERAGKLLGFDGAGRPSPVADQAGAVVDAANASAASALSASVSIAAIAAILADHDIYSFGVPVMTLDLLKILPSSAKVAYLLENDRAGVFRWSPANHSNGVVTSFTAVFGATVTARARGWQRVVRTSGSGTTQGVRSAHAFSGPLVLELKYLSSSGGNYNIGFTSGNPASLTGLAQGFLIGVSGSTLYSSFYGPGDSFSEDSDSLNGRNGYLVRDANGVWTTRIGYTLETSTLAYTFPGNHPGTVYLNSSNSENGKPFDFRLFDLSAAGDGQVGNDPMEGMAVAPLSDRTGASGAWLRETEEPDLFDVRWFGAKGDGVTNDTLAINGASELVQRRGRGTLRLKRNAVHVVGLQELGGDPNNASYAAHPIITLKRFTGLVWIDLNGAEVLGAPGLKFGAFHPTTGLPDNSQAGVGSPDPRYAAQPYEGMIHCEDWLDSGGRLKVTNGKLNGNILNLSFGGLYGDSGAQIKCAGLQLIGNGPAEITWVQSHAHPTDGMTIQSEIDSKGAVPVMVTVSCCEFHFNGRNGVSVAGGAGIDFNQCSLSHTCRSPVNPVVAGPLQSNPKYGCDLEPDNGLAARNISFRLCFFLNNAGAGLGADSGRNQDVSVRDCVFSGDINYTHTVAFQSEEVQPATHKPGFLFENNRFYGVGVDKSRAQLDGTLQEGTGSVYRGNIWSDDPAYTYSGTLYKGAGCIFSGDAYFEGDVFNYLHGTDLPNVPSTSTVRMRNCTLRANKVGTHQTSAYFEGRTVVTGAGVVLSTPSERISGRFSLNNDEQFVGSKAYDFGVLAAGAEATTAITVPRARTNDGRVYTLSGLPADLRQADARVTADNVVTVVVRAGASGAVSSSNTITVRGVK